MYTPTTTRIAPRTQIRPAVRPWWNEVRQGLILAVLGYALFLGPGLLGLFLVGSHGERLLARLGVSPATARMLGTALAILGTVLGYALVMVGHLRCYGHAPRRQGAKKLALVGVLCLLAAPLFLGVVFVPDAAESWAALAASPGAVLALDFRRVGVVLAFAAPVLIFLGVLCFSGFVLAVARTVRDAAGLRAATRYFCYVGFLLGATVGLVLEARRMASPEALVAVPLGWVLCLLWHTLLLRGLVRHLGRVIRNPDSAAPPVPVVERRPEGPGLRLGPYGCYGE
jgi:hypothetical protein